MYSPTLPHIAMCTTHPPCFLGTFRVPVKNITLFGFCFVLLCCTFFFVKITQQITAMYTTRTILIFLLVIVAIEGSTLAEHDPERLRAAGLRRAEEEHRVNDPLGSWVHNDRSIIEKVCSQADTEERKVGVPDEREVCLKRGAALSADLRRFAPKNGNFSRQDVTDLIDLAKTVYNKVFLVWVRIEDGKAVDYRGVGGMLDDSPPIGVQVILHHISFVAMTQKLGGFAAGQTFEYFAAVYDKCEGSPYRALDMPLSEAFQHIPILGYARNENCPNHILVPTTPWINLYSPPLTIEWSHLKPIAVFRGSNYRLKRTLIAFSSALAAVGHPQGLFLDARVRCVPEKMKAVCRTTVAQLREAGAIDVPVEEMCTDEVIAAVCFDPDMMVTYEQRTHRYLLSIDGIGAVDRTARYMFEPGVVVEVGTEFEQYFTNDVMPYVHYAAIDNEIDRALPQLNVTLAWLRDNDDVAHHISNVATQYATRHLTDRSQARYFQLFAALYSSRWDDMHSVHPFPALPLSATTTPEAVERGRREMGGPFGCSTMVQHYREYYHIHKPDMFRWLTPACGEGALGVRHLNKGIVTFAEILDDYGSVNRQVYQEEDEAGVPPMGRRKGDEVRRCEKKGKASRSTRIWHACVLASVSAVLYMLRKAGPAAFAVVTIFAYIIMEPPFW